MGIPQGCKHDSKYDLNFLFLIHISILYCFLME